MQPIRLYPPLGKMLVLALCTLLADLFIYVVLQPHAPHAVAVGISLVPTILVIGRWLIHWPTATVGETGVTLCGLFFRTRFVPWDEIREISRYASVSSKIDNVYLRVTTEQDARSLWSRLTGTDRVNEILLPMPAWAVMLRIARACEASGIGQSVAFNPSPSTLAWIEATYDFPWTWNKAALLAGARTGAPLGLVAGVILALALRFVPENGTPSLPAAIIAGTVGGIVIFLWPLFLGIWLTRRSRGNKALALIAAETTMLLVVICIKAIGGKAEIPYGGLGIFFMLILPLFVWFAAQDSLTKPIGWASIYGPTSARRRDATRRPRAQR